MDAIFKALNDPTRRDLLDRLRQKDGQTLGELEASLEMTRFGVMKHLGVLEEAGLITTKKVGRFKYHYLNVLPLQEVLDRWIEPLLQGPAARGILNLKDRLERPMTDQKPDFRMATYIKCTQDALWQALTDPDQMIQYSFVASSCVREGNTIMFKMDVGADDEMLMLVLTHTEETPKTRIESTFEPHWDGPDVDLARSRFVYEIEPQLDFCKLTLEHYELPADMNDGVADGWARDLAALKSFLETGEATQFPDPSIMAG